MQSVQNCKAYLVKTLGLDSQSEDVKQTGLNYVLDKYLLIHISQKKQARVLKARFICTMIRQAFKLKLDLIATHMLDSYQYKRLKVAGNLLQQLFKAYFNKLMYNLKQQLLKVNNREKVKLVTILKTDILSNGILNSISAGNWIGGGQKVTNVIDRANLLSVISSLRSIVSPLLKTQQHTQARLIDPTHRGRLDPLDTPHGCGLVKNLASPQRGGRGVRVSEKIN